jgi:hypothetical protein
MLPPEIRILLQMQHTPFFSLDCLDFLFQPLYSKHGDSILYIVRYGEKTAAVRTDCVDCLEPCGPRSNLDFVHFMWTTCAFYCTNYAMPLLPSRTSGNKILYVRHYKAEIGGEDSQTCKM